MSFCEFLAQAWAAPSLAALAAVVISILIEYWPAYNDLGPKWKQAIYFGICVILAFGTWGVARAYGCETVDWWTVMMAIAGSFTGGTVAHRVHTILKDGK